MLLLAPFGRSAAIIIELCVAMPKSSKQSTHLCHYANYTHKKADFHVGRRQTRITNK